jgi:hypothetical protein
VAAAVAKLAELLVRLVCQLPLLVRTRGPFGSVLPNLSPAAR